MSKENPDLHQLLTECQFIVPSYEHYGGLAGFQDYGLLGYRVKSQLTEMWRKYFLGSIPNIYEVETPILMPHDVLKASGHVDRFTDPVVRDTSGRSWRADHLIRDHLKIHPNDNINPDAMNAIEMRDYIRDCQLIEIADLTKFEVETENLMFATQSQTYLRPELAQGIFVNFRKYYDFLKELPFGIAQIGHSFRKEVSPKPFLRMREFTQAEIEYFFDSNVKDSTLYAKNNDLVLPLFSASLQISNKELQHITIKTAVEDNIINHPILAYFLGHIYQFGLTIGLKKEKIRFREHLPTEKAHYSSGCWDLECLIDGDWIECVGCANRQSYDLKAHSQTHSLAIKGAMETVKSITKINRAVLGKTYGKDQKLITEYVEKLRSNPDRNELMAFIVELETNGSALFQKPNSGETLTIKRECFEIGLENWQQENYPHVIEPSFGFDRLLLAVFNQNYWLRETIPGEYRSILSLPSKLAPYDVAVLQLSNNEKILAIVEEIRLKLSMKNVKCYTDLSSAGIGRKYVRTDKYGIPQAITVDFQSLEDATVTLRDRDTMLQKRISIKNLVEEWVDQQTNRN
jgi:glycyl-tRNA synthetase